MTRKQVLFNNYSQLIIGFLESFYQITFYKNVTYNVSNGTYIKVKRESNYYWRELLLYLRRLTFLSISTTYLINELIRNTQELSTY